MNTVVAVLPDEVARQNGEERERESKMSDKGCHARKRDLVRPASEALWHS